MDNEALRSALEQHHRESYSWCLGCCRGDALAAEDVLQNVYLKVLVGRTRFEGRSSFKTWLFAVIRTTAAEERRRQVLRQILLLRFHERRESAPPVREPDAEFHRAEMSRLFQQALAALPARQEQALRLVFYHDLSVAEAAEAMGVSLGAARTHYHRGKERLRQWLKQTNDLNESEPRRKTPQGIVP